MPAETAGGDFALDAATLAEIVDEAKRAPSPHNTQPARWRARGPSLELLEDPARRLLASDPSGRDHRLALGAAWEGTRLALGARGLRLVDEMGAMVSDGGVVLSGRVVAGGTRDPLCDAVGRRATWRGTFEPVDADAIKKLERALAREGATVVANKAIVDDAAAEIDGATVRALLLPRYLEELTDWTRFSRDHPSYDKDGMNLEALAISPLAGALAQRLLRRRAFAALTKIGIGKALVSESAQTRSASALVAVTAPIDEPEALTGARFYRAWLTVAAHGLHLCPMSVLTDDAALNTRFSRAISVGGRRLVHLWRVGRAPRDVPLATRLPTVELITA